MPSIAHNDVGAGHRAPDSRPAGQGDTGEALSHVRICDFSGQLAGAGSTKILAAFGAEVIRIEDPVTQGRWDALRGVGPFVDERRGTNLGAGFNNHNVGKLGITVNLRLEAGRELVRDLIAVSDVVCENFAPGVLERWGLSYTEMKAVRPDVIYVSNSGFGHSGPYRSYKTWGPIVQALSGLSFTVGLPGQEPAGWGYSYMDHGAAYYMTIAILAALHHRETTGEGQWVDLASTAAGMTMVGTEILDWSVNGRPTRRPGQPAGNRADFGEMAPHGVYPTSAEDRWIAISCRDDADWKVLAGYISETWAADTALATLEGRLAAADELDARLAAFTASRDGQRLSRELVSLGVPASVVKSPPERIDEDPDIEAWGLFPTVEHPEIGPIRVEGLPLRLSETDWAITEAAPCLGEHTAFVVTEILGRTPAELRALQREGVV